MPGQATTWPKAPTAWRFGTDPKRHRPCCGRPSPATESSRPESKGQRRPAAFSARGPGGISSLRQTRRWEEKNTLRCAGDSRCTWHVLAQLACKNAVQARSCRAPRRKGSPRRVLPVDPNKQPPTRSLASAQGLSSVVVSRAPGAPERSLGKAHAQALSLREPQSARRRLQSGARRGAQARSPNRRAGREAC